MKRLKICMLIALISIACDNIHAQVPFTAGNIVVYRVGDGSVNMSLPGGSGTAFPAFLDEYTPAGVLVQSIALPTAVSGANQMLTSSGGGATGPWLTRSTDGQYLLMAGFNAAPGTTAVTSSSSASVPRVVGVVKYDGSINTTTALTDYGSVGSPSGVASTNGTDLWLVAGSSTTFVRYATVGATTSTQLTNVLPAANRSIQIADGGSGNQLYITSASGGNPRQLTLAPAGLPTSGGPYTMTSLPGFGTTGTPSQDAFADLDAGVAGVDVLYVADESIGITKYSLVGGTWVSNGTVGVNADDYRGLAISVSGTTVTLFATRLGSTQGATVGGGELVTLVDGSGYNGAFTGTPTVIATTPQPFLNTESFRGVALVPEQAGVLPVKLISLAAKKIDGDVQVNWSTASEIHFGHFEVERSKDAIAFVSIGKVNSKNTSNNIVTYSYMDQDIANGNELTGSIYYRLKMVDIDGGFKYSNIVVINVNKAFKETVAVSPNPFSSDMQIKIDLPANSKVSMIVNDMQGRVVAQPTLPSLLNAGEHKLQLSMGNLPEGIYLLQVTINGNKQVIKLVKKQGLP